MDKKILKKLGFTHNMCTLYVAVLESLSPVRSADLIKSTGLTKSSLYDALHSLEDRDLITKAGKGHHIGYVANDPQVLVQEAREQESQASDLAQQITDTYGVSKKSVRIYTGDDAIQQVAEQILSQGKDLYFLSPSKFGVQAQLGRFWNSYHKRREKKNISCKIFYDQSTSNLIIQKRNSLDLCEAKCLPLGYENPIWFMVGGDITGIIIPGENPPLIMTVTSPATAEQMRAYFLSLWKSL